MKTSSLLLAFLLLILSPLFSSQVFAQGILQKCIEVFQTLGSQNKRKKILETKLKRIDEIKDRIENDETNIHPQKVSDFSIHITPQNENIFFLNDSTLDPIYTEFLHKSHEKLKTISSTEDKLAAASLNVSRALGGFSFFHPFRGLKFEHMTRRSEGAPYLIGDFLKNKRGSCRHRAPLLQKTLEAQGISSFTFIGELTVVPIKGDPSPLYDTIGEYHAWVIATTPEGNYLMDPTQEIPPIKLTTEQFSNGQLNYVEFNLKGKNYSYRPDKHQNGMMNRNKSIGGEDLKREITEMYEGNIFDD